MNFGPSERRMSTSGCFIAGSNDKLKRHNTLLAKTLEPP